MNSNFNRLFRPSHLLFNRKIYTRLDPFIRIHLRSGTVFPEGRGIWNFRRRHFCSCSVASRQICQNSRGRRIIARNIMRNTS